MGKFYDCPLKAAWMAKNFGVKFHTGGADFCIMKMHAGSVGYQEQHYGLNAKHWYVHPESMKILEKQNTDLVEYDENSEVVRIIERNGVAFFSPMEELQNRLN